MRQSLKYGIKSGEDLYHFDARFGGQSSAEWVVLHPHFGCFKSPSHLPSSTTNAATAYARVDLGRWIVDCPWCKSAQAASREDHRFFCVECRNVAVHSAWVPVFWPNEWEEIEALLAHRQVGNQWWSPGETLAKLEAENKEHGVI